MLSSHGRLLEKVSVTMGSSCASPHPFSVSRSRGFWTDFVGELHREGGLTPYVIAQSVAADGVCGGSPGTGKATQVWIGLVRHTHSRLNTMLSYSAP